MEKQKKKKRFSDTIFFRNTVFFLGIAFLSLLFCLIPVRIIYAIFLFIALMLTISRISIAPEHDTAYFNLMNKKYEDAKKQWKCEIDVDDNVNRIEKNRVQQKLLKNRQKNQQRNPRNVIRLVKQHSENELEYIQKRNRWKKEFSDQEIEHRIQLIFLKTRESGSFEYQEGIDEIERLLAIRQENLRKISLDTVGSLS